MTVQPYTNISRVFEENYTFQYDMPYDGEQTVTFSVHCLGDLILTSGVILACDPLSVTEGSRPFTQTVPPGNYPVFVSIADFSPRRDKRVACAMLRICEGEVVRWSHAAIDGLCPSPEDGTYGYGVDSGLGCFMDADASEAIKRKLTGSFAKFEEYQALINNELLNNAIFDGFSGTKRANIQIDRNTQANTIIFKSGQGDGGYPCFWGYDASDRLISLVTDFALFYET